MVNKRFNNIVKKFFCMFGTTALVAVAVSGCEKKTQEEKILLGIEEENEEDIEDVEIEENIKEETFEKDGVTYKKESGQHLDITYPILENVEYKEKINDGLINHRAYVHLAGAEFYWGDNEDTGVVSVFIGIEPFFFDESHSKLLSSTEEVSYVTYQLYNARAYLYTDLYGISDINKKSWIPRDESVLGLSEPTKKMPLTYSSSSHPDIVSTPVSLIDTDFQSGNIFTIMDVPGGRTIDNNNYLAIQFLFEDVYENCEDFQKQKLAAAPELDKAILEAEIHYKNGNIEKKYVGFKSYNSVNPWFYDIYNVEVK
ncbi:MAG: hypothetical protein ACI4E1_09955 [Lachnospira sp.]